MPHNSITLTDLAYLAGLFDGEGNITITQSHPTTSPGSFILRVTLVNTNRAVLEWARELLGGAIYAKTPKADQCGKLACFRWLTERDRAAVVLAALLPYLRIKRDEATIAINFQRYMRATSHRGLNFLPEHIATGRLAYKEAINVARRGEAWQHLLPHQPK